MTIKSRIIPGGKLNKPSDTEYHLYLRTPDNTGIIYNEWFSLIELTELPECKISKETLLARIRNDNPLFSSLEDCIFREKQTNSSMRLIRLNQNKPQIKSYEQDIFAELQALWPAGSLHKQARIIGSK